MAQERHERVKAYKHQILAEYRRGELAEYTPPGSDRNVFYVPDQVVVPRSSFPSLADRLESFAAARGRPRLSFAGRTADTRFAALPSLAELGGTVAIDLDPRKVSDTVAFAAEEGAALNHMVTGLQRRTGYPDGDPELPTRPLPSMPAERPDIGNGVTVAVIDTGYPTPSRIRQSLEDTWFSYDCDYSTSDGELDDDGQALQHIDHIDLDRDGYLDAEAGHGLFVAGLVRRMAPGARLLFLKALNSDGMGTELGVARAIDYAVARGAHVINLSLGFYTLEDKEPGDVAAAVEAALDAGRAVVAAAGNDGIPDKTYPAALPDVIGVGALDEAMQTRADFSNAGEWVDVFAPGQFLVSTYVVGLEDKRLTRDGNADVFGRGESPESAEWSGTSFACGIVSGHIAAHLADSEATARDQAEQIVAALPAYDGSEARKLIPTYAF